MGTVILFVTFFEQVFGEFEAVDTGLSSESEMFEEGFGAEGVSLELEDLDGEVSDVSWGYFFVHYFLSSMSL